MTETPSRDELGRAHEKDRETARAFLADLADLRSGQGNSLQTFALIQIRDRIGELRRRRPTTPDAWAAAIDAIDELASNALGQLPLDVLHQALVDEFAARNTPQEGPPTRATVREGGADEVV